MAGSADAPLVPVDALGALRETLSALSNLEGLLRSLKVSPKSVAAVLPDVLGGCEPLLCSLSTLNAQFPTLDNDECLREIERSVRATSEQLTDVLGSANRRTLNASSRLRAEAAVSSAVRELGATLPLLELLRDIDSATGAVNWVEALWLSRSGDQSPSPGGLAVNVTVTAEGEAPIAGLLPRAALNMVRLAAALVYDKGEPVSVEFRVGPTEYQLIVDRRVSQGHRVKLLIPREVQATRHCLRAAAKALGVELELEEASVSMTWSSGVPSP